MRSQGEIESAVCDGVVRFHSEYMGRGPRDIHGHLLGTLLVVRLQDALTPAERRLVDAATGHGDATQGHGNGGGHGNGNGQNGSGNGGNGADGRLLLKQLRSHLVALARPRLVEMVEGATGVEVVSVHHDISTITGEEVLMFSLAASPACRRRRGDP